MIFDKMLITFSKNLSENHVFIFANIKARYLRNFADIVDGTYICYSIFIYKYNIV